MISKYSFHDVVSSILIVLNVVWVLNKNNTISTDSLMLL